ncbi:hypothetical protein [Nocardiopsis sp. FIRDI 009]|uniref:hypothetical protein n=1 Tax=Nocardiopsis sp. FIRDI 009 TaxID=714197 RepID=UPI000E22B647|nr:hypothetical protein [Nocardiopsis sp. FIRDI 009]
MRWLWTWVLGSVTVVLAGAWALPRLLPDLGLGLNELSQLSGIGSLAAGVAALAVAVWTARRQSTADDRTGGSGGGAGGTTRYGGDHVDFSAGTFHGPVTGKRVEHHHRDPGDTDGR